MSRSSSVPKPKNYSNDMDILPRITKNSWLTNGSGNSEYNNYPKENRIISNKYVLRSDDIDNAMNNIDNNLNKKLNDKNPLLQDQLNSIENNYYEMKYMLNNKINRLKQNQRTVNDFLKYSLEQDRLQNDINAIKFNKYIKNYRDQNLSEKEYLLNILNKVPGMIENKMNKIYLDEIEENRNQKQFLDNLKNKISMEFQNQRRNDYIKYKRQLNEMIKLKNYEEKEKILLYHKIHKQKILNRMQAIKYKNQLYRYQAYNSYPFYQIMQSLSNQKKSSFGISMDELMKIYLFKEMIGNNRMSDFQKMMMNNYLYNSFMNPNFNFPFNNLYGPYNPRFLRGPPFPPYPQNAFDPRYYNNSNSKYKDKKSFSSFSDKKKNTKNKVTEKKTTNKSKKTKSKESKSSSSSSSSSSESSSSSGDESSEKKTESKKEDKNKTKKETTKKEEKKTDKNDKKEESKNDDNEDDDDNEEEDEENEEEDDDDDNDEGKEEEKEQNQNPNMGQPAYPPQNPQQMLQQNPQQMIQQNPQYIPQQNQQQNPQQIIQQNPNPQYIPQQMLQQNPQQIPQQIPGQNPQ